MDLKDKIVGLALAALIALVGWNLKEILKSKTKRRKKRNKMISLLVTVVLLFNIESSFDDKKQASTIKKTVQIIKTIHGVKWGEKL